MAEEKILLTIEEIEKILPHRFPFILIDRVIEYIPDKKLVAIKNVSINEQFFTGHFPGAPVMPGVLIIEAMAQAGIIFFAKTKAQEDKKNIYYLGKLEAKFISPVYPSSQLRLEITPLKLLSNLGVIKTEAFVGEKLVAQAQIYFGVKPYKNA